MTRHIRVQPAPESLTVNNVEGADGFEPGQRVQVRIRDPESWATLMRSLPTIVGTVEARKPHPFVAGASQYLVRFDTPVRKRAFLSEDETGNYLTHFHFEGPDLVRVDL